MEDVSHIQPLTSKEIEQLRAVIEKEARWQWLAVMARNLAVYITVVITGVILFWETLTKIVKGMVK